MLEWSGCILAKVSQSALSSVAEGKGKDAMNQTQEEFRERVESVATEILKVMRDNLKRGPADRDRCLENLNALAFSAAFQIKGCNNDPDALEFFMQAFNMELHQ